MSGIKRYMPSFITEIAVKYSHKMQIFKILVYRDYCKKNCKTETIVFFYLGGTIADTILNNSRSKRLHAFWFILH